MLLFILDTLEAEADKEKLALLFETYQRLMFTIAYRILDDEGLSEDAAMDAFISIAKHLDGIEDVDSARTKRFMIVVTENKAHTIQRKRFSMSYGLPSEEDDLSVMMELPQNDMILRAGNNDPTYDEALANELLDAISSLPDLYREILALRYMQGFSIDKVAQITGLSYDAVAKRIERGKTFIKDKVR